MTYEKSCGAVVFTCINGTIKYVLAQALKGHYGFPKGHMEPGETEEETALREIYEEVYLQPSLLQGFRAVSEYRIPHTDIQKQVIFFLGEYRDQEIVYQKAELRQAVLVSFEEAMNLLQHEENKRVLMDAHRFLGGNP